jgi:hypothetical protein
MMPAWRAVADLPAATLDAEGQRAFAQGRELPVPQAASPGWIRVHGPGGFLGVANVQSETGEVLRIRARRVLFPDGEEAA